MSVHACMCVFVHKKEREQWRPNNEHDHWASQSTVESRWSAAMMSSTNHLRLEWVPGVESTFRQELSVLRSYCHQILHGDCLTSVPGKIYFVSIIAKFLGEDLSRHEQSMFKRCFTSHLSCLFESDLTSRAQGHAADLSLCFCVWASTPTSSVSVKFVFLFLSAELLLIPFTSSATPLLLIDCTLTWSQRSSQRHHKKCVWADQQCPPIPNSCMTVLLSLFMSKWHNNYNSLMSQIFGIHAPVFFLYASLHIQDIRGILWNCRNSATPFSTFLQSGPLVSPVCFVEYHDAFQQEEVRLWHRAVWSVWWVAQCAWPTSPL